MTYPGPYAPPPHQSPNTMFDYYNSDGLDSARRAAGLMFGLGGVILALSLCCGGLGLAFPRLAQQQPEIMLEMQSRTPQATPDAIRRSMVTFGIVAAAVALVFLFLAAFVRRGSKGGMITAVVFTVLLSVVLVLQMLGTLVLAQADVLTMVIAGCVFLVPIALLSLQVVWLIAAMRGADHRLAQQYAMQYMQYAQQQQQLYAQQQQQQGYPYQQPPPPPPSSPDEPPTIV